MRTWNTFVLLLFAISSFGQEFQLAPPLLRYETAFPKDSSLVNIEFDQPGAFIYYSLDGSEPGQKSLRYSRPFYIKGSYTELKVKAFAPDLFPSETDRAIFVQGGLSIEKIVFSTPHEAYQNKPANILHDNNGGVANYSSPGWLGYVNDTIDIHISIKEKTPIRHIMLNLLEDQASWIFLPASIQISVMDSLGKWNKVAQSDFFNQEKRSPRQCVIVMLAPDEKITGTELMIRILALTKIPSWHTAAGSHPWFFIDEIKVF